MQVWSSLIQFDRVWSGLIQFPYHPLNNWIIIDVILCSAALILLSKLYSLTKSYIFSQSRSSDFWHHLRFHQPLNLHHEIIYFMRIYWCEWHYLLWLIFYQQFSTYFKYVPIHLSLFLLCNLKNQYVAHFLSFPFFKGFVGHKPFILFSSWSSLQISNFLPFMVDGGL